MSNSELPPAKTSKTNQSPTTSVTVTVDSVPSTEEPITPTAKTAINVQFVYPSQPNHHTPVNNTPPKIVPSQKLDSPTHFRVNYPPNYPAPYYHQQPIQYQPYPTQPNYQYPSNYYPQNVPPYPASNYSQNQYPPPPTMYPFPAPNAPWTPTSGYPGNDSNFSVSDFKG